MKPSPSKTRTAPVAQASEPAVSPTSLSAGREYFWRTGKRSAACRLGNLRHSRLGSLRYITAMLAFALIAISASAASEAELKDLAITGGVQNGKARLVIE